MLTSELLQNMLKDSDLSIIDISNYIAYHYNAFDKLTLQSYIMALSVYISLNNSDNKQNKEKIKTIYERVNYEK